LVEFVQRLASAKAAREFFDLGPKSGFTLISFVHEHCVGSHTSILNQPIEVFDRQTSLTNNRSRGSRQNLSRDRNRAGNARHIDQTMATLSAVRKLEPTGPNQNPYHLSLSQITRYTIRHA